MTANLKPKLDNLEGVDKKSLNRSVTIKGSKHLEKGLSIIHENKPEDEVEYSEEGRTELAVADTIRNSIIVPPGL